MEKIPDIIESEKIRTNIKTISNQKESEKISKRRIGNVEKLLVLQELF
ncbi:MAG: hypothetical protein GX267_02550 [Fibrobacter sp.]|jgi:hypothetical protein|nr:hypothetical protein [Fibrobacter sp.]